MPKNGKPKKRAEPQGVSVSQLIDDTHLDLYGYLLLPFGVMQKAGSATQTVAGIRSHWGRETFADERTIATAACLDESTVRRRHLPKLFRMEWMGHRMIESRLGHRREWYFAKPMAAAYFGKKSATLPRWAALSLPEWSYRAVFATVLQRSLATSRGSKSGPVALDTEAVLWGGYGRHNFSLSHLCNMTGLTRRSVIDAKHYLLANKWLTWDRSFGRGEELYLNSDLIIDASTLQEAHRTTRSQMFSKAKGTSKGATNANPY
jgi:hypothetical protein